MTIKFITQHIVGYRFSDLCVVNKLTGKVSFITEKFEKEVVRKFEDGIIDIDELTPEFLAIILDLDFVEFSDKKDAIIGKKIAETDIGTNDQEIRNLREIEQAETEVRTKVEALDRKIVELANIKSSIISDLQKENNE